MRKPTPRPGAENLRGINGSKTHLDRHRQPRRKLRPRDMVTMHLPMGLAPVGASSFEGEAGTLLSEFLDSPADFVENLNTPLMVVHGQRSLEFAAVVLKAMRAHRYYCFHLDWADVRMFGTNEVTNDNELGYRERAFTTDALAVTGIGSDPTTFTRTEMGALCRHRLYSGRITVLACSETPSEVAKGHGGDVASAMNSDFSLEAD